MKKRNIRALALALTLALAGALPAAAAEGDGEGSGVRLSVEKTVFDPGEEIAVSYSGVTAGMAAAHAWIGISAAGADAAVYFNDNYQFTGIGSGSLTLTAPAEPGEYELRFYTGNDAAEENFDRAAVIAFTVAGAPEPPEQPVTLGRHAAWAEPELTAALEAGLIHRAFSGIDLTRKISRAEFAAAAVQLYEVISDTKAEAAEAPFSDIGDEPLRDAIAAAWALGITNGVGKNDAGEELFDPGASLSREQMATMLCRVVKRALWPDWTLANDAAFPLPDTGAAPFTDDALISDWAKESVYYMAGTGILRGMDAERNLFGPRNVTPEETAADLYTASREQALVIAARVWTAGIGRQQ